MSTASGRRPGTFAEDGGMVHAAAPGKIPKDLSRLEDPAAQVLEPEPLAYILARPRREAGPPRVPEPEPLAYILAGAGDRDTTRENARAFRRWRIRPRRAR